ncbi:MAG: ABC transporter permease [Peptostreptococcaceae bacterium]|nr:ABC transporter permease [Peptostreptococcaceae bacterium]
MEKKQDRAKNNKRFIFFLVLASLIVLVAIFAPLIAPYDLHETQLQNALHAPSKDHIFGTDNLGKDILSSVIYGTRVSVFSTLALVASVFVIGSFLGIVAGYFGGWVDSLIMRIADIMIAFPGMVLAIAVAGILGPSITNAIIAVTIVTWPKYARLARSLVLKIKNYDHVVAARVVGGKTTHILMSYMFPNVMPVLLVTASMDIGSMMLELAALSFLGFGARPPMAEWGLMLSAGRAYMSDAPWMMLFPGGAILLVVVIFNLLGDSLRDILDPKEER